MKKPLFVVFILVVAFGATFYFALNSPKALTGNVDVTSPDLNNPISSPITIKGYAKGKWFFEGSFPVYIVDWDGRIIGQSIAKAKDDWMTDKYVPFEVTLQFTKPSYGENGSIIFKKDNPSGLPENDDSVEIQIKFK